MFVIVMAVEQVANAVDIDGSNRNNNPQEKKSSKQ